MAHAKIGPNTIIQTVRVVRERYDAERMAEILRHGGQDHLIEHLPTEMVYEDEFHALVWMLIDQLGAVTTAEILDASGAYTAHYLLQHRIPKPFQHLLKLLPRDIALTLFLLAISQNAWTFAGSGKFTFVTGSDPKIIISNPAPLQQGESTATDPGDGIYPYAICHFYAGTFETLLRILIDPQTTLQKVDCQTDADIRCGYTICFMS